MNSSNVIKAGLYEMRRVLLAKPYLLITIFALAYAGILLRTQTLLGYNDTAPYSEWTFLSYLLKLSPFLTSIPLFFVARQTSPKEKAVEALASAASMPASVRHTLMTAALGLGYLLAAILAVAAYFVFCIWVFAVTPRISFLPLAMLALIPQAVFFTGLGLWMGRFSGNLVYALIAFLFFAAFIDLALPPAFDLLGNSVLAQAAHELAHKGVVPFFLPSGYLASRAGITVLGLALCIGRMMSYRR
jgi:hypothetical protein